MIRRANEQDISRIAEILVFVKRMKYRSIFHNDEFSFGELQVLTVAKQYMECCENNNSDRQPARILDNIWVYDDGIVKGLIHIEGNEVIELYVDYFFWGQGVGSALLKFAIKEFGVDRLWVLEKNTDAIDFYKAHGFIENGRKQFAEGTEELEILLVRKAGKNTAL